MLPDEAVHNRASHVQYQVSRDQYIAHLVPVLDHARPACRLTPGLIAITLLNPLPPGHRNTISPSACTSPDKPMWVG